MTSQLKIAVYCVVSTYAIATAPAASIVAREASAANSDPTNGGATAPSATDPLRPLHDSRFRFVGSRSCAATACHGKVPVNRADKRYFDKAYLGMEHSYWMEHDSHARAYTRLHTRASVRMLGLLGITDEKGSINDPTAYKNCQSCHNLKPARERRSESFSRQLLSSKASVTSSEGVSCEACHGPAERWLGQHFVPEFRRLTAEQKADYGMCDTKDLLVRAALCAECHVGSAGSPPDGIPLREVNHDMIAAGHPALRFELAAYHDLLPKHWNHDAEKARHANFELQLWAYGQLVTARAALELLELRAAEAAEGRRTVWPELSEYSCFACHHDLTSPSWRPAPGYAGGRIGLAPLRRWNYALVPVAASALFGEELGAQIDRRLASLKHEMETEPIRGANQVASQTASVLGSEVFWNTKSSSLSIHAEKLASELTRQLRRFDLQNGRPGLSHDRLSVAPTVEDWDTAAQIYLAFVSLDRSSRPTDRPGRYAGETTATLRRLQRLLAFPMAHQSPTFFDRVPDTRISAEPKDSGETTRQRALALIDQLIARFTVGSQ
jgi:hypothetical protein